MTYTELTETGAKPNAEEIAALSVLECLSRYPEIVSFWQKASGVRRNRIFAELVKAVKGEG